MKELKKIPTIEQLSENKINVAKKDDVADAKKIFNKLGKDHKLKWDKEDHFLTKVTNDAVILSVKPYSEDKHSTGISVEHKEFVEKFKGKLNEGFEEGETVLFDPKQKEELKSKGRTDDELNAEWEVVDYDGSNLRVRPIGDKDTTNVISLADSRFIKKEKANEAVNISADVLAIVKMLNFTSDFDNPNEYDYMVDGNQFEAISPEIATDISNDLTANNIEHELNDVYINLTGIVSEDLSDSDMDKVMSTFNKDEYSKIDADADAMNYVKKLLRSHNLPSDGDTIIQIRKAIASIMNEALNKDDFLVGDATGYSIPDEAELDKSSKEEIHKKLEEIFDAQYAAQTGNKEKELNELTSKYNFIAKYMEVKHGVELQSVKNKKAKLSESFSISAGNAKIESKEQALALIPAQKEVDDELVDFEEGEKITVSDGENEYKFVWEGGKAVDAPEEEPITESYGDELGKVTTAFKAMEEAMKGSSAGDTLTMWLDLGTKLGIIGDDNVDNIADFIQKN